MDLVRLVSVEIAGLDPSWLQWSGRTGDVEVAVVQYAEPASLAVLDLVVVAARTGLPLLPQRDEHARLLVPEAERRRCEVALEEVANALSAANHHSRSIRSPLPYIALIPASAAERDYLDASTGILAGMRTIHTPNCRVPLAEFDNGWFDDRRTGVALLGDALSSSPVGRYRDLVRLFENAFRVGSASISSRLAAFLDFRDRGYSRLEVEEWMAPRNPLSHGDRQDTWPHEADVRMLLPRMEQAAIDVLFNKATWRDSSTTRRAAWHPPLWTESRDLSKLVGIRGRDWRITAQPMDLFGRYPFDLRTQFATLAPGWWTRVAQEGEGEELPPLDRSESISFLVNRGTLRVIDPEDVAPQAAGT